MDWDKFWSQQLEKNQNGTPVYSVTTDSNTPAEVFMREWIEKWHPHFRYFNNTGCGCCINFYEFDVPKEAVDELPSELIELSIYEDLHSPPKTGRPSSFLDFSGSLHSKK